MTRPLLAPPRAAPFKKPSEAVSHALLAWSHLALLALLAASCIENPGVDPELGQEVATPETALIEATFREARILQFRVTRDSGRLSLRAVNRGLGKIDSAAFLLQASALQSASTLGWGFDPRPAFEYYGRLPALQPGEGADLGVIDSLLPGDLDDYYLYATLTHASEDGRPGSPFGGVYTGTHGGIDTSGAPFQGALRGVISADGAFRFHVSTAGSRIRPGLLMGSVTDSGGMAGSFDLGYRNPGRDGRFHRLDRKVEAAFAFKDSAADLDSLWLACDPYSPR